MKRVFSSLVNNPFMKQVIASNQDGLTDLLQSARYITGDNLLELYSGKEISKDRVLAITALKTLIYLDNWIKKTTIKDVEKKEYYDQEVNAVSYCVYDNSKEYSMIEEIAYNHGFMDHEDMAEDIITASLAFLNGEGQEEYRTGVYNPAWGRYYNPSPYPWNVLKRKYDELSRNLHLRAAIPVLEDKDGDPMDQIETLDLILSNSNSYQYYEACNGRDLQDTITEIDYRLCCALYGPEKADNKTFLLVDQGVYYFDYAAIKARISTLKRTKSGMAALMHIASILGLSKEGRAALIATGKISTKEKIETARGMKAVREKRIAIASSQGLKEVKKLVRRGRPKKVGITPVKRGRGRPKKNIA